MRNIEFEVKDVYNGKQNIAIKFDGKEVGVIYLDEDEKLDLLRILRRGSEDEVEIINNDDILGVDDEDEE